MSWKDVTLGDIVTLKRGYDLPTRDRNPGTVPIVSSSGITGRHDQAKVAAPGVVTGRYGTLGEVFYLQEPFWPLNTTLYVRDFKGNNPRWVSYFLAMQGFAARSGASAVPGINRNALHMLPAKLPPVEDQKKIASTLAAYDELIENNLRRIEILEELAQAIHREWLVNFRFPGHKDGEVVDATSGSPPRGWMKAEFGQIASEVREGVHPTDLSPDTPYVGLEHIPRRSILLREWGRPSDVSSRKWSYLEGDILFGKLRPYFHKVVRAPHRGVCSTDAIVIRPKDGLAEFALLTAASEEFVAHATSTAGGTDRPRANWNDLATYPVHLPPKEIVERFSEHICPIVRLMLTLAEQNRNLRTTRDLLLPRLISGEIDVSDLDIDTSCLS